MIRGTRLDFNLGTLAHVVFGFLAVWLGYEWLFTVVFLVKQVGDRLFLGEDWEETSGDLVEYMLGFIAGIVIRWFTPLF